MSFDVGATVVGKYRILRVLGQGGMGTVFQARHLLLETDVALKLLRSDANQKGTATERLVREGRALARLRGKHIARVIDVEAPETGPCCLVLEYLDGEDLGCVLARSGPLPVDLALTYVLQVCEALAEAHAQGIVHRDIKPSNLFLTTLSDGSRGIKVIDFGISKDTEGASTITHSRAVIGSPSYMAPEQMRAGARVDSRSDIWSLGVVLYELLTGKLPYRGECVLEICAAILESQPAPLKSLRPELPSVVDDIIRKCLARDPAKRFQSVAELAQAIVQFAGTSTGGMAWILPREAVDSTHSDIGPPGSLKARETSNAGAHAMSNGDAHATSVDSARPRRLRRWSTPTLVVLALGLVGSLGLSRARSPTTTQVTSATSLRSSRDAIPSTSNSVDITAAPGSLAVAPSRQTTPPGSLVAAPASQAAPPGSVTIAPESRTAAQASTRAATNAPRPDAENAPQSRSITSSAPALTAGPNPAHRGNRASSGVAPDPVLQYGHY